MDFILDYTFLRLIWWALLGILFWSFMVMDGFDLGVATLLPFIGRSDMERRVLINTVGPVWEGNQVWLILGAGAIFAAWPYVYSVLFSGLYLPFFGVLCSLILRPVGFKYRSKVLDTTWRNFWDFCLFLGGIVPAFCFGLILGNLILGVPFHFDADLRLHFSENSHSLLHPFACCSGLLWVFLCVQHGGIYLLFKTEVILQNRVRALMAPCLWAGIFLFTGLLGLWRALIPQYKVLQMTDAPSNPLNKIVGLVNSTPVLETLGDYLPLRGTLFYVFLTFVGLSWLTGFLVSHRRVGLAFIVHGLLMGIVIAFMGLCQFPIIVLSSTHPNHSLTLWDASSSFATLEIMLVAALIFVPIIMAYTAWVYKVMRGPVREKWINDESGGAY